MKFYVKYGVLTGVLVIGLVVGLAACGEATQPAPVTVPAAAMTTVRATSIVATVTTVAPATSIRVTATTAVITPAPVSNATTAATSTTAPAEAQPDLAKGLAIFRQQGCAGCHGGDKATGGLGPALNNISFPVEGLLRQVRGGAGPMPAFPAEKLPDTDVKLIYDYLLSLKGK